MFRFHRWSIQCADPPGTRPGETPGPGYEYDAAGNLRKAKYFDPADQTNPKSVTEYWHDDFGRLVRVQSPDAGIIAYGYDDAGNVTSEKRADGTTVTYSYDASNRLTAADYPGTDSDVAYTYDDDTVPGSVDVTDCRTTNAMSGGTARRTMGRLSKVVDQSGTRWFNYDTHGRVVATWDKRHKLGDACARVSEWTYDAEGRVTSMRLPTGRKIGYVYDGPTPSTPRSVKVYSEATTCPTGWSGSPCAKNVATEIAFGGGSLRRWRDSFGSLHVAESMLDGSPRYAGYPEGARFEQKVTATDALGNPTSMVGPRDSDAADTLTYTPWFHWLESSTQSNDPNGLVEYELKPTLLGDRTSMAITRGEPTAASGTSSLTYASGSSRMTSWDLNIPAEWCVPIEGLRAINISYTAGGAISGFDDEMRVDGTWSGSPVIVEYDGAERMEAWNGTTFAYDFRNLRTRKVADVNDRTTDFWYDDRGQLLAELGCDETCVTDAPRPLREHVWLAGRPIALIEATLDDTGDVDDTNVESFDVTTGLLGQPLQLTDSYGYVRWSQVHSPFSELNWDDGRMNLRIPGQYLDAETGLHYNWNRYYWPMVGRYTGADPLLAVGMPMQPYGYADGNPVLFTDPKGLFSNTVEAKCRTNPAACPIPLPPPPPPRPPGPRPAPAPRPTPAPAPDCSIPPRPVPQPPKVPHPTPIPPVSPQDPDLPCTHIEGNLGQPPTSCFYACADGSVAECDKSMSSWIEAEQGCPPIIPKSQHNYACYHP